MTLLPKLISIFVARVGKVNRKITIVYLAKMPGKNEPSFLLSMRSEHGKCEAGTLGPRKALDLADSGLKSGLSRAPL
jgi:hypothetical protein